MNKLISSSFAVMLIFVSMVSLLEAVSHKKVTNRDSKALIGHPPHD